MPTIFDAAHQFLDDRGHKYAVTRNGRPITYADALQLWQDDGGFRGFFLSLLADSPFSAYRWETPPVTNDWVHRPFEFVLVDCPGLARSPDAMAYAEHFTDASDDDGDNNDGVVVFDNLGKDALLVVPSPRGTETSFGHLAAFVRGAADSQRHALWRTVGRTVQQNLSDRPLWLSTAGGGVAWLHVRLDKRPKYYAHAPYKMPPDARETETS